MQAKLPVARIRSLETQLRRTAERIGKERDRLRELLSEYTEISENCDEAIDMIERAADELSGLL